MVMKYSDKKYCLENDNKRQIISGGGGGGEKLLDSRA